MLETLPPGLVLILGAVVLPLLPERGRGGWLVVLPLLSLAQMWQLPLGEHLPLELFGHSLLLVHVDALARVFGTAFHLAAFLCAVYSVHVRDTTQHVAALLYAGAAVCAVFAGDLATLFVAWEGTAIASVFLIWARGTERSYRSGMRYLIAQVASGVLLLAAALGMAGSTGSIAFTETGLFAFDSFAAASLPVQLLFLAFGIKAAFPLLHSWLQDAYPEATPTGTVWLSAFTTKLAIYALARGFLGTELLIPIGLTMAVFPLLWAAAEDDLRRVLAWALNNQLGFMVVALGIGGPLALNAVAAHAVAHILYKGLLFMAMGAVLYQVGTARASRLGGLWPRMKWTALCCLIGAGSMGLPLTSSFVTKSMIFGVVDDAHLAAVGLCLMAASAGVFFVVGFKLPWSAFFAERKGEVGAPAPLNMRVAMALAALLCIGIGCAPGPLLDILPMAAEVHAYDMQHVVTALQLVVFVGIAFFAGLHLGLFDVTGPGLILEWDWTFRRLGRGIILGIGWGVGSLQQRVVDLRDYVVRLAVKTAAGWTSPSGALGEPWPIGEAALCAAAMLAAVLLLSYG